MVLSFLFYIILCVFNFSRHEVPVTSQQIAIVHMDDDIVVVNKPASIPVSGLRDRHIRLLNINEFIQ